MRRREWLLLPTASLLWGDERQQLTDWLGELAARLSEDDPEEFLDAFDKQLRGRIDSNVRGMLQGWEAASTVDILSISGEGDRRTLELDWFLRLTPRSLVGAAHERRTPLTMVLRRAGKGWRAVALTPIDFFSPPKPSAQ
ncbi:MAG: hypothetical protein IANPNBLG_03304 [Bryobacteraceae bacterium]|nr:hypothetical protein [Bryobacteraceae bacterium]